MVFLIRWHCDQHFRWFHSGIFRMRPWLRNFCHVARHTADVRHLAPDPRACKGELPENLLVRVSATKIDGQPLRWWPTTSTVVSGQEWGEGICGAKETEGSCGPCRDCWNPDVPNVAYRLH